VEQIDDTYLFSGLGHDTVGAGVFVATYQSLAPGAAVELELELPNGPLRALGEVRWTRIEKEDAEQRPGIGIVFIDLSPEAVASLADVVRSYPTRYYEV
jgi:Tfp pilus assembly protein PilZ